jgi:hypothetical protein
VSGTDDRPPDVADDPEERRVDGRVDDDPVARLGEDELQLRHTRHHIGDE